jgi:hypothetical protein
MNLLKGNSWCPTCQSNRLERRGFAYTKTTKYQNWHCLNKVCGSWFRGNPEPKEKGEEILR